MGCEERERKGGRQAPSAHGMPHRGEEGRPENKAGQAKPCLGFPFSLHVLLAQRFPLLLTQAVL